MKRMQKMIALIMTVCMVVSMIPAVGAAGEKYDLASVSAQGSTASVRLLAEGDCSVFVAQYEESGRMLGVSTAAVTGGDEYQTLSLPLQESETDFDLKVFLLDSVSRAPLSDSYVLKNAGTAVDRYSIVGLDAEAEGIVATVSTNEACTMEVQVWDQDEQELLFTTTAEAAQGLDFEYVSAEYESMPDYFIMRAVLKDEDGNAVSNPYTNRRNTQAFREFDAQTEADFRDRTDVTFLEVGGADDGNFMVLNSDVTYLDDAVSFTGESDGVLNFENAGTDLTGLAAGDLFAFRNGEGEYETVKIKEITVNDGVVSVVRDEKTYLSDFYDVIKINADLTYEVEGEMPETATLNAAAGAPSAQLVKVEFGPAVKTNLPIGIGSVEGHIRVGGKVSVNYDPKLLGDRYMDVTVLAGVKGELDITLGVAKNWKDDITMGSIPLAGLKEVLGAAVNVELVCEIDADFGYSLTLEFENTYGLIYSTDTDLQIVRKSKTTQSEASSDSRVKGEVDIELGVRGELSVSLLDELIEASVGAEGGIAFSGEAELLNGLPMAGLDSYHACGLCAHGDCKSYFEVDVTLDYEINPWLKGNLMDLDIVRIETTIGSFYLSLINDEDSVHGGKIKFDWADECPNKKYRVKVVTLDNEGQEVEGCSVTIKKAADTETEDSFSSPSTTYLYPGSYLAQAKIGQNEAEADFTVTEGPQTVYINGEDNTLGGDVTNQFSGELISGVKVEISQNGTVINTTTTSNIGHYSQKLPDGIYSVKFSAEGYEDKTIENVEVNDDKTLSPQLKPNMFNLTFDANGGSGSMNGVEFYAGQKLTLPACEFTAPEGMMFSKWEIGEEEYKAGETYTMPANDLQITAIWGEPMSTITVTALYEDGSAAVGVGIEGTGLSAVPSTGTEGTVSFDVPVGTYCLTLTDSNNNFAGQTVEAYGNKSVTMTLRPCEFNWTLENGVLTFSGHGPMPDYADILYTPWADYYDQITSVVIDGLASVGNHACSYCENISSISWGDNLLWIGDSAFSGNEKLSTISIPYGVFSVGDSAFAGSSYIDEPHSLTSVTLPATVKTLGKYAFGSQYELSRVIGLEYVERFGERAFYGCRELGDVSLGDKVTSVGSRAFAGTAITEITLPDSVTFLGDRVFLSCAQLTDVVMADSIHYILDGLFVDCTALKSVKLPGELRTLGASTFQGCTALTSIVIPDGVTEIWNNTFDGCTALEEITIPASVTKFWYLAFDGCTALKNIYFGGTEEQWTALMQECGNPIVLNTATIHYNYTPAE